MKKIVITFGLISGAIITALMFITLPMVRNNTIDSGNGEIVGYTTMVISFSMIFIGIKSLRDNHLQGVISFGKGLKVGLLIALIASLCYAISWEFYFNIFAPDFMDEYVKLCIDRAKEGGKSEAEIQAMMLQMNQMKEWYKNPVLRFGITLAEILPVGILISLLSAAILRRKNTVTNQTTTA